MNRIVLIGNGFDLAHDLNTNYRDFLNHSWKNFITKSIEHNFNYYNDDIRVENNIISPIEDIITPHDYQTYISFKNILRFRTGINLTVENHFLEHLLEQNSFKNWVDIENRYYDFLSYLINPNQKSLYNYYDDIKILNSNFKNIQNNLEIYLSNILQNNNIKKKQRINNIIYSPFNLSDFIEKGVDSIARRESEKIDQYINNTKPNAHTYISSKTISYIDDLKSIFEGGKYELGPLLKNQKIASQYFDLKPDNVLFLNFNYTNLEKLYSKHRTINVEINHIHGELKSEQNPIIFGYGDELEENYQALENKKDNAFLENIKSIKYLETDNYKRMLEFIESDHYQIIILGHSCGNSDRTLLNTLFEHKNCVSIKPYYYRYREKGSKDTKDNYSDIVRNISRNFKDKKSMRDKVVNKKYCDWFSEDIKE